MRHPTPAPAHPVARLLLLLAGATALRAQPPTASPSPDGTPPAVVASSGLLVVAGIAGLDAAAFDRDLDAAGFGRGAAVGPLLGLDLAGARGRWRYGLEFGVLWQPTARTGRDGRRQQTGAYHFTASTGFAARRLAGGTLLPTVGVGGTHRFTRLDAPGTTADRTNWRALLDRPGGDAVVHASTLSIDLGLRWQRPGGPLGGQARWMRELRAGYRVPVWGDRPSVQGTSVADGPQVRTGAWYAGLGLGLGARP